MEIYTIGFTQTTAESFFERLAEARIERLLDIRLKNVSQLAGFAKAQDLPYFLQKLLGATYEHDSRLAPTEDLLSSYRQRKIDWETYERDFLSLLAEREIQTMLDPSDFDRRTALLCSEQTAECCHRRLVCEYLQDHWSKLETFHL